MEYDNKINDEGIRPEIVNWVKVAHDNFWDGVFLNGDECGLFHTRGISSQKESNQVLYSLR